MVNINNSYSNIGDDTYRSVSSVLAQTKTSLTGYAADTEDENGSTQKLQKNDVESENVTNNGNVLQSQIDWIMMSPNGYISMNEVKQHNKSDIINQPNVTENDTTHENETTTNSFSDGFVIAMAILGGLTLMALAIFFYSLHIKHRRNSSQS